MTAGIAAHTALDTAWITRVLTSAEFTDFTVKDPWVTVNTEAGSLRVTILSRAGLLCFTSAGGSEKHPLPSLEGERSAALALLQHRLDVARVSYYADKPIPFVRLEYDVPILAGLSRAQFVSMLRAFAGDVAVARQFCWDGE